MKTQALIATTTLLLASGCANIDKHANSFEPMGQDGFRFQSYADVVYKIDSDKAEALRIEWLEEYLALNNLCANGYEITDKKDILKTSGLLADTYDVIYYGQCT